MGIEEADEPDITMLVIEERKDNLEPTTTVTPIVENDKQETHTEETEKSKKKTGGSGPFGGLVMQDV